MVMFALLCLAVLQTLGLNIRGVAVKGCRWATF